MATSSMIQMNISSYMFLGQLLVEKNIFHMRLGFNFFSRETCDDKGLIIKKKILKNLEKAYSKDREHEVSKIFSMSCLCV